MNGAMHETIVADLKRDRATLRAALITLLYATMYKDHPLESQQAIDALEATAIETEGNTLRVGG